MFSLFLEGVGIWKWDCGGPLILGAAPPPPVPMGSGNILSKVGPLSADGDADTQLSTELLPSHGDLEAMYGSRIQVQFTAE